MTEQGTVYSKIGNYLWLIIGVTLTVSLLIWYILKPVSDDVGNLIEPLQTVLLAACSAVLFAVVAKQFEFLKTRSGQVMTMIASGLFLWMIAETIWTVYVYMGLDPFPSEADLFWIIGYFPSFIALIKNAEMIKMKLNRTLLALWVVLSGVTAVFILGVEVVPFLLESADLETVIAVTYPTLDILLIVPALLILFKFRSGEIAKPWAILLLGFFLTSIGDIWYVYSENAGTYVAPYSPVDLFLSLGYVAFIMGTILFIQLYRSTR